MRKNVKDSDDKGGGDADAVDFDEGAAIPGANPSAPQKPSGNKKAKLILPWEVQSFYAEQVPEREDEEDEEEEEQNEATLARLASADERTRHMTKDEYVYWSDCRQASFTFRKGKRFREWAGFGTIIDTKPNGRRGRHSRVLDVRDCADIDGRGAQSQVSRGSSQQEAQPRPR